MPTKQIVSFDLLTFTEEALSGIVCDYLSDVIMESVDLEIFSEINVERLSQYCWKATLANDPNPLLGCEWRWVEHDINVRHAKYVETAKGLITWIIDEHRDTLLDLKNINITDVYCIGGSNYRMSFMVEGA